MDTKKILLVDKPIGLTPLQTIDQIKEQMSEYADTIISYAGRLDPMAHGLLILLIGEENKNRERYLDLKKTYEVEILFGFETDTYDVLGKVVKTKQIAIDSERVKKMLSTFIGKKDQPYPPYSSKTVKGKPLFWWARENKLDEIEIPKRMIEIYSIAVLSDKKISGEKLWKTIEKKIKTVSGDFRQKDILDDWQKTIDPNYTYTILKIEVSCSSGTYMRSLGHKLGKIIGSGAIAYDIYRTKVGEFSIEDALEI